MVERHTFSLVKLFKKAVEQKDSVTIWEDHASIKEAEEKSANEPVTRRSVMRFMIAVAERRRFIADMLAPLATLLSHCPGATRIELIDLVVTELPETYQEELLTQLAILLLHGPLERAKNELFDKNGREICSEEQVASFIAKLSKEIDFEIHLATGEIKKIFYNENLEPNFGTINPLEMISFSWNVLD